MFNTHSNNQGITGYILHSVAWLGLFLILPPPNGSGYEGFITMILSPIFFFIPIILSIIIRIKSKKIYTYWDYGIVMIFIFLWLFMLSPFEGICGIYTVCDTVGRDIIYLTMALSPLVFAFKKNLSKIIFMIGIALLYGVFSFIYFIYLPKELGIMRQYLISKSPEFHKVYADYYDRIGKRFNTPTRIIEDIKLNIPNVANHFSIDNQVEHVLYFLPWITDKLTSSTEKIIANSPVGSTKDYVLPTQGLVVDYKSVPKVDNNRVNVVTYGEGGIYSENTEIFLEFENMKKGYCRILTLWGLIKYGLCTNSAYYSGILPRTIVR